MVIVETPIFTRLIKELMSDNEYRRLQEALIQKPDMGSIIKASGGLRKARWNLEGRGKSVETDCREVVRWIMTCLMNC